MIVFDEYFNYPGWRGHEFKAFQEFVAETGRTIVISAIPPSAGMSRRGSISRW